jgi:hypothetical protein
MEGQGNGLAWRLPDRSGQFQLRSRMQHVPGFMGCNARTEQFVHSEHQVDFVTFNAAVSVLDASLTAQSGAGTEVVSYWHFGGDNVQHALCGSNDTVPQADRIFAGM